MPDNTIPVATPVGNGDRVIAAGDTMVSLAEESGHFWQTIWNDPANADLKRVRQRPNVLLAGDRVTVPPLRQKWLSCANGQRHRFRRRGVPTKIAFVVRGPKGEALGGRKWTLQVGTRRYEGQTGPDGRIEQWIETAARTAELKVWLALPGQPEIVTWTMSVGDLGPIDDLRGIAARLRALGYRTGDGSSLDDATRAALAAFQRDQGLEVTEAADAATIARLAQVYGF